MTWIGDRGGSGFVIIKIHREIVAAVARKAHNLEVEGSIPSLATKKDLTESKVLHIFENQTMRVVCSLK